MEKKEKRAKREKRRIRNKEHTANVKSGSIKRKRRIKMNECLAN